MSLIEVAPEIREDLYRILEHVKALDFAAPSVCIDEIFQFRAFR
jgi:hypothetical protein